MKKLILIIISILVLAGIGYTGYLFFGFQNQDKIWAIYKNEEYGIQFNYPAEWKIFEQEHPNKTFFYDPVAQAEYEELALVSLDEDDFSRFIELTMENIPGIAKKYAKSPRFIYYQGFLDNKISLKEFVYRTIKWVSNTRQPKISQETLNDYFKDSNLNIFEKDGLKIVIYQRYIRKWPINTAVIITPELMAYYLDFEQGPQNRNPEDDKMFEQIVNSFKIIK